MPVTKNRLLAAAAALAGCVLTPAAAQAASAPTPATSSPGACPDMPTTTPYTALGDSNAYFMAPGGDFEPTLTWGTTGSYMLSDTDRPPGFGGRRALVLKGGATTTSTPICVDGSRPSLRFAVESLDGDGTLTVQAIVDNQVTTLGSIRGASYPSWSTSPVLPLSTALAIAPNTTEQVQLRFVAGQSWVIDAVAVDPRRAG